MFLNKNRVFAYFISLVIVFIALYTMPLNQPIKYIIFIIINFFLITSATKKNYNLSKKLLVFILIFISSVFIINNLNLKFSFDIKSFNKENSEKLLTSSIEFFEKNYPECIKINCFGSNPYQVTLNNSFYRNNLDINNIHELRTDIFYNFGSLFGENEFIDKFNYPYEINFKFPKIYYGSKLCYKVSNFENTCKIINADESKITIIGVGEKINIYLVKNYFLIISNIFIIFLFILLTFFILNSLVIFRIRERFEILYPLTLIFWLVVFSLTNDAKVNFLNSYFYEYLGGDGYEYLKFSNILVAYLKQYNIIQFLRGGVDVFYFMPGMRYFIAIEKVIFGNSYFLHLIIFSFLPFLIRKLLIIYLSKKMTYLLLFSFLLFPIMHHMGFSFYQYIRYTSKVFAEPVAYTIFIFGFIRLVYYYGNKSEYVNSLPFTTFILCLSCLLRPNLSPSCFILLIIPYIDLLIKKDFRNTLLMSIFGFTIFLPFLHNYYFGNKLILFTSAVFAEQNIKMNISDYINLFTTFELEEEKKIMLIEIMKNFFNPYEIHKYFILLGVLVSFKIGNFKNRKLLPLYILMFSQFFLFLFLNPGPRYIWIFWLAALIISINSFTNRKSIT